VVVALSAALLAPLATVFPTAGAGAASIISSCTPAAVQHALTTGGPWKFTCSGTISVPQVGGAFTPFTVAAGTTVALNATGHTVVLDGEGSASVLTMAAKAQVTLTGLTIFAGLATGTSGTDGPAGTTGTTGKNGAGGGKPGQAGGAGGN
jgi:hypothetical protein